MQNYILSGDVIQVVGDYLVTKPYVEVANLITQLSQAKAIGETIPEFMATLATMQGDNKEEQLNEKVKDSNNGESPA